jgi:branched-chain amino acid transport system substrate-binding protein
MAKGTITHNYLRAPQVLRALLLVAIGLTVFVGCTKNSSSSNEIIVGEFDTLTGSEATFGISTSQGERLAIDEKNAAGGIRGRQIKLITYDNQGKAEEAASVVKRLITQDHALAILGEVASTRSLFAAPVAQQFKVPMISPSSTSPKVTQVGDYIFRVCFIDAFQGHVMAKFAHENLKLKNVAILKDMKSEYSIGLADVFAARFKEMGGTIADIEDYQSDDTDFKAQLTQIRGKNPDGIFIPGYYTGVGLMARQARQLGIKAVLLGGDGWESPKLVEIGKDAVLGSYFSTHFTAENSEAYIQEFVKKYKEKYHEVPDGLAGAGYDAALALITAMEHATDPLTPENIRNQIAQIKNLKGVTGNITIKANRDADKAAVIVQVTSAGTKFVTSMTP